MQITESELIEALHEALLPEAGEDGFTMKEIQERTGHCREVASRALKRLIAEGRAEVVKVTRTRLSGVVARTAGYRLT